MLKVLLLGQCKLLQGGVTAHVPKHGQALLAYLALASHRERLRADIAELLWDGPSSTRKRHSLSQLLYEMSKAFPGALRRANDSVSLSESVWADVLAFREFKRQGDHQAARDLYCGPFLHGLPFISESFDDWRIAVAAALENEAVEFYQQVIRAGLDDENFEAVATISQEALEIRPHDEFFALTRVEALAASGDTVRALRELDYLRRRIVAETGHLPRVLSDDLRERLTLVPRIGHAVDSNQPHIRIIGRSDELRLLRQSWAQISTGARAAFLRGEPGVGKTRLLQQVLRRAAVEGGRVFAYTCSEAEERLPYSGIVGLIRDGYRDADSHGLSIPWVQALATITPEIFPDGGAKDHPQRNIWEAVAQFFMSIAEQTPVAIAFDNVHWLDETSSNIVSYISRRLSSHRVMFLAVGAPARFADINLAVDIPCLEITVNSLSDEETDEFIGCFEELLGVAVSPQSRKMLRERIGGNPFFLKQALIRMADLGGDVEAEKDLLRMLATEAALHVSTRFKTLSDSSKEVAALIACMGRSVPITLLSTIAELPLATVSHSLRSLVEAGIVADEPVTRFTHDLYRQGTLHSLPEPIRASWHARIARVMADHAGGSQGEVAYHYERAGDLPSACQHAMNAAREATHVDAPAEAEEQYSRALRCATRKDRQDILFQYGQFLLKVGRLESLVPYVVELENYLPFSHDPSRQLICDLVRFSAAERNGMSSGQLLDAAKEILYRAERHMPADLATVLWQVGDCMRRSGERHLLSKFASMLVDQTSGDNIRGAAELLAAAALMGGVANGYKYSAPLADQAVSLSMRGSDAVSRTRALFARGTAYLCAGYVKRATSDLTLALQLGEHAFMGNMMASIKSNLCLALSEQDQFEDAEEIGLEAVREAQSSRRAYAIGNLALLRLRMKDASGVKQYCRLLTELDATTPQPWIAAHVHALLGLAAFDDGALAEARLHADALQRLESSSRTLVDATPIALLQARVENNGGDCERARTTLRIAAQRVRGIDWISHARLIVERRRMQCRDRITVSSHLHVLRSEAVARGVRSLTREIDDIVVAH